MDKGFDPDHLLFSGLSIGMKGDDEATGKVFFRELQRRLAALPGVQDVALASRFPLGFAGGGTWGVEVDGYPRKPNENTDIRRSAISTGYFATLRFRCWKDGISPIRTTRRHRTSPSLTRPWPSGFGPARIHSGPLQSGRRGEDCGRHRKNRQVSPLDEIPKGFFYTPFLQGLPGAAAWDLAIRTVGAPMAFAGTLPPGDPEARIRDVGILGHPVHG